MLVISRFHYPADDAGRARADLGGCLARFAERPGYLTGHVGRAADDPGLWVLVTRWEHVGAYRRALSSYEVKAEVVPLLSHALDEPSAYEVIVGEGAVEPNVARPRGEYGDAAR
jgi:hypothetical protein